MANNVHLEDFSRMVIEAVKEAGVAILHEAAGEVVSQTQRNLGRERGRWHQEQKEQWQYKVDNGNLEATIGNPMERSLWTEFGTGSYAEGGKGRKGYWVYVKGSDSADSPPKGGKSYTLEEAKQIMAMLRADGLDAHITKGQSPKRPFRNAYNTTRPKIERRAAQLLNSRLR
jgi:hypothetical protein